MESECGSWNGQPKKYWTNCVTGRVGHVAEWEECGLLNEIRVELLILPNSSGGLMGSGFSLTWS